MSTESVLLLLTLNGLIFHPLALAPQSVPYHIERDKAGGGSSWFPSQMHYLLTDYLSIPVVLKLFDCPEQHF